MRYARCCSYYDDFGHHHKLLVDILYSLKFITDFVTWIVTFYQLMMVVMGVMHEADSAYSIESTSLCYQLV